MRGIYDIIDKTFIKERIKYACEIAIIIDDCKYYSLFVKNDAIPPKIKRLLMDNSIREITILDKENADRLFGL